MTNFEQIGTSIRSLRKSKRLTLQELAARTGLSTGYLSNIERNVTSPTLMNLQKICEVFQTSLGDLLERNSEEKIIIRKNDRGEYPGNDNPFVFIQQIDFGIDRVTFLYTELKPDSDTEDEWWTHEFGEIGIVIDGELTVNIEGNSFLLKPGDCIYVKAHTRHSYCNKGKESCKAYWARIWDEKGK